MKNIAVVLGTRPEIIKLSTTIPRLKESFGFFLVHTGQHFSYEMDQVFFEQLRLPQPQYQLEVGSGGHGQQTGKMLIALEPIFQEIHPDLVLVQGDTNSALSGGLAAAKLGIPVAHIEAGCRSYNRAMPEELNRVIVDHLSNLLFTPDDEATDHLRQEGIAGSQVVQVGSTGVEACLQHRRMAKRLALTEKFDLSPSQYILVTVHRAETTDSPERLRSIVGAINALAASIPVVFPLHPRTQSCLEEGGLALSPAVHRIPPQGYLEFMSLLLTSWLVLTDSGGVQEEAATLHIPYLVLRDETEWGQYIKAGQGELVGWESESITNKVSELLGDKEKYDRMKRSGIDTAMKSSISISNAIHSFLL